MVKFYSTDYSYDYSFSAVSLAFFLRYPNPYSRHVASTDTISRNFDPETQRLTTVRLHVKRSRLPPAVLRLIPRSTLGADENGSTQSFILETSVVDVKQGWMEAESRNLDWNNVLSVIERHRYARAVQPALVNASEGADSASAIMPARNDDRTDVSISVTLKSRIGEQIRKRRARWGEQATASSVSGAAEEEPKRGWFGAWSSTPIRAAIETISLQRTEKSQPKAQKGMNVVLERLRNGGLVAVLEGMRRDREIEL
jgi:4-amino-4-deoxychorismate lyase